MLLWGWRYYCCSFLSNVDIWNSGCTAIPWDCLGNKRQQEPFAEQMSHNSVWWKTHHHRLRVSSLQGKHLLRANHAFDLPAYQFLKLIGKLECDLESVHLKFYNKFRLWTSSRNFFTIISDTGMAFGICNLGKLYNKFQLWSLPGNLQSGESCFAVIYVSAFLFGCNAH